MPEVILPFILLDNVAVSAADAIVLVNENPAPNEVEVPLDANVVLDIAVPSGDSLATASVTIEGVVAWTLAGGFQTGFSGSTSNPDADTTRITINPDTDFTSSQEVNVDVAATATGSASALASSYLFNAADVTPPQVVSATGVGLTTVRVLFNEAMTQVNAANANDALNPANYLLAPNLAPAVTPTVTAVTTVSTTEVELTTSTDVSPGIPYTVTVSGATDLVGNAVIAPDNEAVFSGFVPPVPAGREFDLYRMLPRCNREEDITQDLLKFVACLLFDIDRLADIIDPDLAPEPFLSTILLDLGNPFNFEELSEIDKRRLVRILVPLYKQKGTCVGIINAVRFFVGVELTCDEFTDNCMILGESELGEDWILCPSALRTRLTFTLVSPVALTDEQRTRITAIAELMKPAGTHLGAIVEPDTSVIDHLELGISELGDTWILH